ncbi:hypothetical protein B0H13DRAFT_2537999 [Mycena leptocephala]|nr:hypothetical protein B0H13DRAFT_2537999 [Mycena leptocephala]
MIRKRKGSMIQGPNSVEHAVHGDAAHPPRKGYGCGDSFEQRTRSPYPRSTSGGIEGKEARSGAKKMLDLKFGCRHISRRRVDRAKPPKRKYLEWTIIRPLTASRGHDAECTDVSKIDGFGDKKTYLHTISVGERSRQGAGCIAPPKPIANLLCLPKAGSDRPHSPSTSLSSVPSRMLPRVPIIKPRLLPHRLLPRTPIPRNPQAVIFRCCRRRGRWEGEDGEAGCGEVGDVAFGTNGLYRCKCRRDGLELRICVERGGARKGIVRRIVDVVLHKDFAGGAGTHKSRARKDGDTAGGTTEEAGASWAAWTVVSCRDLLKGRWDVARIIASFSAGTVWVQEWATRRRRQRRDAGIAVRLGLGLLARRCFQMVRLQGRWLVSATSSGGTKGNESTPSCKAAGQTHDTPKAPDLLGKSVPVHDTEGTDWVKRGGLTWREGGRAGVYESASHMPLTLLLLTQRLRRRYPPVTTLLRRPTPTRRTSPTSPVTIRSPRTLDPTNCDLPRPDWVKDDVVLDAMDRLWAKVEGGDRPGVSRVRRVEMVMSVVLVQGLQPRHLDRDVARPLTLRFDRGSVAMGHIRTRTRRLVLEVGSAKACAANEDGVCRFPSVE